jgi:hypothetical protein
MRGGRTAALIQQQWEVESGIYREEGAPLKHLAGMTRPPLWPGIKNTCCSLTHELPDPGTLKIGITIINQTLPTVARRKPRMVND